MRLVGRKPIPLDGAFFAALIAVATHLLLDLTNVYGVRLLLPFSARWLQLDLTQRLRPVDLGGVSDVHRGPFLGSAGGVGNRLA